MSSWSNVMSLGNMSTRASMAFHRHPSNGCSSVHGKSFRYSSVAFLGKSDCMVWVENFLEVENENRGPYKWATENWLCQIQFERYRQLFNISSTKYWNQDIIINTNFEGMWPELERLGTPPLFLSYHLEIFEGAMIEFFDTNHTPFLSRVEYMKQKQ